jgi:hypothetical protein
LKCRQPNQVLSAFERLTWKVTLSLNHATLFLDIKKYPEEKHKTRLTVK